MMGARQHAKEELVYDLRAVIVHHGESPDSGHYKAIVRHMISHRFHEFSDGAVRELNSLNQNIKVLRSSEVYVVFLVRRSFAELMARRGREQNLLPYRLMETGNSNFSSNSSSSSQRVCCSRSNGDNLSASSE